MDPADKVRENRLRRMARRRGYSVVKSRARDPRAITFGTYAVVDDRNNLVFGDHNFGYGMDLDAIEEWLNEP